MKKVYLKKKFVVEKLLIQYNYYVCNDTCIFMYTAHREFNDCVKRMRDCAFVNQTQYSGTH